MKKIAAAFAAGVLVVLLVALFAGAGRVLDWLTVDGGGVDEAPTPAPVATNAPSAAGVVLYEGSQFSTGSLDDTTGEFTAPAGCSNAVITYAGRSQAGGAARVTWRLRDTSGAAAVVTVGPVDIPPQSGVERLELTPGQTYQLDVHTFGVTVAYSLVCE